MCEYNFFSQEVARTNDTGFLLIVFFCWFCPPLSHFVEQVCGKNAANKGNKLQIPKCHLALYPQLAAGREAVFTAGYQEERNVLVPFGAGTEKGTKSGIKWKCHFSHRCGPCLRIAPAFSALSNKYPQATFLEVDVHQCQVWAPGPPAAGEPGNGEGKDAVVSCAG